MAALIELAAVDDDCMLLEGVGSWIAATDDLRLVATASTVDRLLETMTTPAHVVLLDLMLNDHSDPTDNVRRLVSAGCRVLVVSVCSQMSQVVSTFSAGASGYVTKDHRLVTLASAIRDVAVGGAAFSPELAFACLRDTRPARPRLSQQERAVLLAYASGMTLHAAARHIGIRSETAKTYLKRVKAKYHDVGRPTYTKLDLADRVREDQLNGGGPFVPQLLARLPRNEKRA